MLLAEMCGGRLPWASLRGIVAMIQVEGARASLEGCRVSGGWRGGGSLSPVSARLMTSVRTRKDLVVSEVRGAGPP